MTDLIANQIIIIIIMGVGGLCAGLLKTSVLNLLIQRFGCNALFTILYWIIIGGLYNQFTLYCDNGKLTFTGLASFVIGLMLWKKLFCDIIFPGEDYGKKE